MEGYSECLRNGDPNGIRTRVTAVKGQCPNRWTIGSEVENKTYLKSAHLAMPF